MEKNIYSIIQDWHELFKNGTITEDEFNSKKNELLNYEKLSTEAEENAKETEKIEYEKSKFFFNKAYIFTGIVFAIILFFIIYSKFDDNAEVENENYGTETLEMNP